MMRIGEVLGAVIALSMSTIVLSIGTGGVAATPVVPDGAALFKQRCAGCHSGAATPVAPNLAGVVGRKAAATGYHYSSALAASGLVWTRPKLDAFLAGPLQLVPGTRMVVRVGDPAERAAIIDYLARTR